MDTQFQDRLNRLRRERGLSQEDLAEVVGVTRQAVQKWESGASRPDMDNLAALAQYFGVTLDYLVLGRDPSPDVPPGGGQTVINNYYHPSLWEYEYKSERTLWGLPLVHIHLKNNSLVRAKGIIAVGNVAVGLVSVGIFSVGVLSFGVLALGVLALGCLAAWVLSAGGPGAAGAGAGGGAARGAGGPPRGGGGPPAALPSAGWDWGASSTPSTAPAGWWPPLRSPWGAWRRRPWPSAGPSRGRPPSSCRSPAPCPRRPGR